MSLELEPPSELAFERPLSQGVVKTTLVLRNNSLSEAVAFKIKTTAPKQYCVRPNAGLIPSGQVAEVQVLLQPLKEEPPMDAKCSDKFLVLAMPVPSSASADEAQTLLQKGTQDKNPKLFERKVRVAYSTETQQQEKPLSQHPAGNGREQPAPQISMSQSAAVEGVVRSRPTSGVQTSPLSPEPAGVDDKQAEIARLRAMLEKSQRELMEARSEMRLRTTGKPASTSVATAATASMEQHQQQQYSLVVLLAVALLAFVVGVVAF